MGRYYNRGKRAPSNYALDKKIKKMQRETELKYNDEWLTVTAQNDPDTENNVFLLNGTVQGSGAFGQRIGNEIYPTSVQYRGFIYINNLEATVFNDVVRAPFIRVIIFWDKMPNGEVPVIVGNSAAGAETLLDVTIGGASPIWAPYNHSTATRFKILSDKTYRFNPSSTAYYGGDVDPTFASAVPNQFLSDKISLSRTTRYSGDGGTIATVSENGLFVTFISTFDDSDANYNISFDGLFRVYYKDE